MPGKFSFLGRSRSTKAKSPLTSSSSSSRGRKETSLFGSSSKSRPTSSHGTSSGGLLRPSGPGSSSRRSRSHETSDRTSRPPLTSTGRDVYDRPGSSSRRVPRLRSVSPRPRPLPTTGSFRAPRPRPRRDSSISEDDSSRPISRRPSLSPPRVHADRIQRPRQDIRRPSLSPPRFPPDRPQRQEPRRASHQDPVWLGTSRPTLSTRPTAHPSPVDHYIPRPPIGSRATSYNSIPQVLHEAATGSRASTPPKFKPQVHQNIDPPRNSAKLRTHEEALRPARQSYDGSSSEHPGRPHHDTQPEHPSKQDQGSKNPPKPGHGPEVRVTAKPAPKPSSKSPPKSPPKSLPNKSANLFKMIPEALAAYGGLEALSEHADTAKGWADWLNQIRDAPEEIHGLSAKVQTARDTITQIQNTLEARPDLVEGDSGQRLRSQIEAAIKSSNEVLTKMTKVLQDLSETTAEDGSIMSGVQEFYNSYKYRNEYENKIKEADGELQKELSGLSTLMINLYSRSLMKPAPSGSIAPTPPPVPITSTTEETKTNKKTPPTDDMTTPAPAEEKPPTPAETSSGAHLDGLEPPPIPQLPREHNRDNDARPPSPSTVGEEEANIGLGTKPAGVPATTHPTPPNSTSSPSETKDEAAAESKSDQKQPSATSATPAPKEDPKEALLDAAWYGDLEAASEALRHAPVTVCDQKGLTPLHLAAERDNLAMAMLLLDHHADANSRANGGRTPLHLASRFASAATVELLVEDGHANTNARTTDGRTPLHYAASSAEDGDEERREVVRVLRDWDADPTAEDAKGRTPRDVAQKRDYWDISSTLRRAEKRWEDDHPQGWFQRHGFRK